mmetsp:Transcript_8159/g.30207  ORF Transcript_8159/g.30207 Transcript_8159/m.30207 type:complete len:262 (-) Transcript_8159:132-917(-)
MEFDENLKIGWKITRNFCLISGEDLSPSYVTYCRDSSRIHADTEKNDLKKAGMWSQLPTPTRDEYCIKLLHRVENETVKYFLIETKQEVLFLSFVNTLMQHARGSEWKTIDNVSQLSRRVEFAVTTIAFPSGLHFHRSRCPKHPQDIYCHFSAGSGYDLTDHAIIPSCSRIIYHLYHHDKETLNTIPIPKGVEPSKIIAVQPSLQDCFEVLLQEKISEEYEPVPMLTIDQSSEEVEKMYEEAEQAWNDLQQEEFDPKEWGL